MATPYTRQARITCKCIQTRLVNCENSCEPATYRTTSVCALTDNYKTYLHKWSVPDPEFDEGASYILKNGTISTRWLAHLLVGPATQKYPLVITEDAVKAAQDALCPPSTPMSGNEDNIYSTHGYKTLLGQGKKVSTFINLCLTYSTNTISAKFILLTYFIQHISCTYTYTLTNNRQHFTNQYFWSNNIFNNNNLLQIKVTARTKQEIEILGVS